MPSIVSIRRPLCPFVAGVAFAGCLTASTAAIGQSLSPAPTGGLRGTGDAGFAASTPSATADQFRSTPSSSFDSTRPDPSVANDDPATTPTPDPAASEPPRRATTPAEPYQPQPKPPGVAKPVKPLKQYGPKKTVPRTLLPPLQPYRTKARPRAEATRAAPGAKAPLRGSNATARNPAVDEPFLVPQIPVQPGPTIAALPTPEPRRVPIVDPSPYAPVGIGVGSLRLTPYIEIDGGYDTNPDQTVKSLAKPSALAHVEGGATVQSDWSRHALSADLHGGYYDYFSNRDANRPDGSGTVTSRIDVTRDTTIDSIGRFTITTQRPGSPEVLLGQAAAEVNNRPLSYSYGGESGVTQKFGRLAVSLRGSIDRFGFDDATFSDGSVVALSRNNYNQYGAKARLSYELTPSIAPFGEGYGNVRRYDSALDSGGTFRNSTGEGARVGSKFELGRTLTGEASVGYEHRDYASKTLGPLQAPLVDASIVYQATPLTTATLRASTELDETNIAGSSGAVGRRVSFELSHALLRNLVVTGLLAYQNFDYNGVKITTNTYDIGLKADYALSRSVVVRGSFTHERLLSGTPGLDYTQNVFLLGLRLQR